jgi:hypothetical protein
VALVLCAEPAAAAPASFASAPAESRLLSPAPGLSGAAPGGVEEGADGEAGEEPAPTSESSAPISEAAVPTGEAAVPTSEAAVPTSEAAVPAAALVQTTQASPAGHAKYRLDAATYFNPYAEDGTWIQAHVDVIKAFPTFGDIYVKYGKPVIGYHDPATEGFAPLKAAEIEDFVAKVKRDMGVGYAGVFVDDANWSFTPSPGPEANLANLMEAIRRAEPSALIEMNSQYHDIWPKMKAGDPYVARALAQVNLVTKEFGVGPDAAIDTAQDYAEFMTYADALRAKGIHIVMTGDKPNSAHLLEYNLATCLLVNDGGDFINMYHGYPGHFWKGFAVNLGNALAPREALTGGLWRRRFEGGVVYALAPGGTTRTIKLGKKMHSTEWGAIESITLEPERGAVLAG